MKKQLILFAAILGSIVLTSHELFLKTDAYFLQPGQASELYLFNGTFDQSENEITRDRIINAKILGPDHEFMPEDKDYYDKDKATYLKFKSSKAGTYVAGVSTLPRTIELTGKQFNDYLTHEGLDHVMANREQAGILDDEAKEIYSKHVKAILQVGDKNTDDFSTVLGYPIEFVPVDNPYSKKAGDEFSFQLLVGGNPLPNQTVHYSTSMPGKDAHANEKSTKTDEKGVMTMTPTQAGKWYVATIHMVESDEDGVDYESNWATLTFAVK
ncbi:DUF4198 domain-containing protein [Allomuricauda sp. d1]|uniref:DUF4198 domain-containing protein n=1 Tax=Allomuricauda sp. d1 TaxID=3136725 RepID=UPI0031D17299